MTTGALQRSEQVGFTYFFNYIYVFTTMGRIVPTVLLAVAAVGQMDVAAPLPSLPERNVCDRDIGASKRWKGLGGVCSEPWSEETRKRDQWGCGNDVLDTVERIDRSSVLYFFVKASEDDANALSEMIKTFLRVHPPSVRKHEAYVRHRAANNIQSMVRRCGFRGLVKSALEAKRQADVSFEILSVGPTDARDDDDDDDKNKAFSFGSGLTKVAPTQPAPICHGSVICGGPWDTLEAPPDVDLSNVECAVVPPG